MTIYISKYLARSQIEIFQFPEHQQRSCCYSEMISGHPMPLCISRYLARKNTHPINPTPKRGQVYLLKQRHGCFIHDAIWKLRSLPGSPKIPEKTKQKNSIMIRTNTNFPTGIFFFLIIVIFLSVI